MAMLYPTYRDIIKKVNEQSGQEEPMITSRYSVVIAAAKRARQLIDGATPYASPKCDKPLSIAVEELATGKVKILSEEEAANEKHAVSGAEDIAEESV